MKINYEDTHEKKVNENDNIWVRDVIQGIACANYDEIYTSLQEVDRYKLKKIAE